MSVPPDPRPVGRRAFIRAAGAGALAISAFEVAGASSALAGRPPKASADVMRDAGAGMHSTKSTATLIAVATMNPRGVTCGVTSGPGTDVSLGGFTGPFVMEMYATTIDRYDIDRAAGTIRAAGQMRSITIVGGQTVENVVHPYLAVGVDGRSEAPDDLVLSFLTPFWNPGNPMATASEYKKDWVQFGGAFLVGEVNVAIK